jgi:hypothetical protein
VDAYNSALASEAKLDGHRAAGFLIKHCRHSKKALNWRHQNCGTWQSGAREHSQDGTARIYQRSALVSKKLRMMSGAAGSNRQGYAGSANLLRS